MRPNERPRSTALSRPAWVPELPNSPAARYAALLVGLGAAGLAIGWIGPDLTRRR